VSDGVFEQGPSLTLPARTDLRCEPRLQLRAAAALHSAIGSGTAVIDLPGAATRTPEQIADLLEYAWQQPGLRRFRFRLSDPQA